MTETHSYMFYMNVMPRTERNIIKQREAWVKLFADLIGNDKMNGCKGGHQEKKPMVGKNLFSTIRTVRADLTPSV